MKIYNIKDEYIEFIKQYDAKVPYNKSEHRPYVGVVLEIDGINYYAPLSSPKLKHRKMKNSKDFRKINQGIYGAINFNNMLPVVEDALILIDIPNLEDDKYKRLLQNQYDCIRRDREQIARTAKNLHTLIFTIDEELNESDRRIKQRCCNLPLLESIMRQYKIKKNEQAKQNDDSE
ncbi:MAG: type III toxin-antitoxin system ToxN/AbiQ family toxin [Lachnospiraceae bacterium]|nr:type III toxin-antitoxin system ToxN/AbiQ family toxin [Lachnospiraceae bacterium]